MIAESAPVIVLPEPVVLCVSLRAAPVACRFCYCVRGLHLALYCAKAVTVSVSFIKFYISFVVYGLNFSVIGFISSDLHLLVKTEHDILCY